LAIHCQVITSQVMACRPDRDCPVIGRPVPRATAADCRWQRKVILTILSVKRRYFGRVTTRVGRKPARAGHEPAGRRRQAPRRGCRRGAPPAAGCLEREYSKAIIWAGRPMTVAAVRQLGPRSLRGILIGLAVRFTGFTGPVGRPGPDAMAGGPFHAVR
jgi:hypothetical protein